MSEISSIGAMSAQIPMPASYNAVKIRVNKPQVIVPSNYHGDATDNGIYNAVNIAIDKPTVIRKDPVYNYPEAKQVVTYDMTGLAPVSVPVMPVSNVSYQPAFIAEETVVKPDVQDKVATITPTVDNKVAEAKKVPEPNITTVEAEKAPAFNGKKDIEIVPPADIKPDVDINDIIAKLSSNDYDVQAVQLAQIAQSVAKEPEKATAYVVKDIFTNLIGIMNKNTDSLEGPTQEQINIRKQIIMNELVKSKAREEGKNPEEVKLPYEISEQNLALANKLSPLELVERNKEYAMYTTAVLCKVYIDEIEKQTGNVVAIVDLPGITDIVNILNHSDNAEAKIAALQALDYIKRPEYAEDLKSIYDMASKDANPYVAKVATEAKKNLS